jgi:thiol-disulfide isomerase/thioredoxin
MVERVSFLVGGAASLVALPFVAHAEEPTPVPDPAPSPSPRSAKQRAGPKADPSRRPHVHGSNHVTKVPENRRVEWVMDVLDGPRFRLSDYRSKVVFCNLFATWCPPCRVEQPGLVAFARAHLDDTTVIGIDVHEEDNDVRAYRKKFDITYPIAMHRSRLSVPALFIEEGLIYPTTLAFHPDGTLSCAWRGDRDREWFEAEREYALADRN